MMITARMVGAVLGTASLVLLSGCGSSAGSGGSESGLAGALDSVAVADKMATSVSYGDIAQLRELGAVDPAKRRIEPRWNRVVGVGFDSLANVTFVLPQKVGLDILKADRAITIGEPPDTAVRIDGDIDSGAVTTKLKAFGAKSRSFDGTDGLSFGPDDSVDQNRPITKQLYIVNQLDQVVVDSGQFAASPNAASLEAVLGKGDSLLDEPHIREITDCLGDVVAAVISAPENPQNSAVIAVGVRDPGSLSGSHEEVVCSAPADGKAEAVKAAFTKSFSLRTLDQRTHYPLSHYASKSTIDTPTGTVRAVLTLTADQPPGYVLDAYYNGGAQTWDSSS